MHLSPLLWFLLDSLATFRLTRLVTTDTIFDRPRTWLSGGIVRGQPRRKRVADFLVCPWCTSMWLSAAVLTLTVLAPWWGYVAAVLAFSAVAGLLGERS